MCTKDDKDCEVFALIDNVKLANNEVDILLMIQH